MKVFSSLISFISFLQQLSPSEDDRILESRLGNYSLVVPEFISDPKKLLGINTGVYPQTPSQVRAPPVFPTPNSNSTINNNVKQLPISNGITTSSSQVPSAASSLTLNRPTYNNNSQTSSSHQQQQQQYINNYQQQSSSQKPLNLLPPPSSRANTNGGISTNSNTFLRPTDNNIPKPLTNGIGRSTIPQLNKHEVNRTFYTHFNITSLPFLFAPTYSLHFTRSFFDSLKLIGK